jgi:hypothetical protein
MQRVKLFEPIVCSHYSATLPVVTLVDPTGQTATLTPVTEGDIYTVSVRATKLGTWKLFFDAAVYQFEVTQLAEIEEALGVGTPITPLTHVHGSVPAQEFAVCYDVPATPLWVSRSQGAYVNPVVSTAASPNNGITSLWHHDKLRVPYAGWVTGVRVTLVADLSASNLDIFQFIFFHGSAINAMRVRGRTENIDKSRLAGTDRWIQFQKPVYCHGGEWIGLRTRSSSGNVNTVRLNAIHPGTKAVSLVGATSADGSQVSASGRNWVTDGVEIGDTVYFSNRGVSDGAVRTVTAVDSTNLTVTPVYTGSLVNCQMSVGDGVFAESGKSGYCQRNGDVSDTATNEFFANGTIPIMGGFPGILLMTRPVIALTGDSVMGGTGQTGGGTGTLHDHHVTTAYAEANDMASWIHKFTGAPAVNASRGGSYITVYQDKYTPATPLWNYLNQQWASVAEYKPSVIIYNSIHNDGNPSFGAFLHSDTQYLHTLDLLWHHAKQIGAEMIFTTGTPLAGRSSTAGFMENCQRFRALTRHFCARNGVRLIDTERLFHAAARREDDEPNAWHDNTLTTVFGRELYDYFAGGTNVHLNSVGTDGANGYLAMGKHIAEHLQDKARSHIGALLWRLQTRVTTTPANTLDVAIMGIGDERLAIAGVVDASTTGTNAATAAAQATIAATEIGKVHRSANPVAAGAAMRRNKVAATADTLDETLGAVP